MWGILGEARPEKLSECSVALVVRLIIVKVVCIINRCGALCKVLCVRF